jgi:hypothetical protein
MREAIHMNNVKTKTSGKRTLKIETDVKEIFAKMPLRIG